jgi:UDPglucose--hexose-1-phosphate uridylyltransferase
MIDKTIEELLYYATLNFGLNKFDIIYFRNQLLKTCKIEEPFNGDIDKSQIESLINPDYFINSFSDYAKINLNYSEEDAESFTTFILGLVTPLPSVVNNIFWRIYNENGPLKAGDYLYYLSINNGYIRKSLVDKNEYFNTTIDGRIMAYTINLAKPEKDNKDIQKALLQKETSYPKCVLCHDNVGFYGKPKFPARQNLRDIDLKLDNECWHLQFSPYVYYDHHLIVISDKHEPMTINYSNMSKLFAFIDLFPNYFIGSNSDLPIVGGSILNHEHFQGGQFDMPLFSAKKLSKINPKGYDDLDISLVDWWNNVICVEGESKERLLDFSQHLLDVWRNYDDESIDLISHDDKGVHNTLTLILRDKENFGKEKVSGHHIYSLLICLRNNRCSDKYPNGIFHSHVEHHHIKKEGIGLIEVLGLFVLPARLARQISLVERVVNKESSFENIVSSFPDMLDFKTMIDYLTRNKISANKYVAKECANMLSDTQIFKDNKKGKLALAKFLNIL